MRRYDQAINNAGRVISTSSHEIATTVQQQERAIAGQAISVNQTTSTIEELGASSHQSAEQATASAANARQALVLAEEGTKAVHQTIRGMSTLKDKVEAIAQAIIRLSGVALNFLVGMGAESAVSRERTITSVNAVPVGGSAAPATQTQTSTETRIELQRIEFQDSTPLLRGLQALGDERTNAITLIGTPKLKL